MKTGYFNIKFCIFNDIKKILLDINNNDIKIRGKIVKFQKYFLIFLLTKKNWAGPGPPILGWA